jgi:hypothetical protein
VELADDAIAAGLIRKCLGVHDVALVAGIA